MNILILIFSCTYKRKKYKRLNIKKFEAGKINDLQKAAIKKSIMSIKPSEGVKGLIKLNSYESKIQKENKNIKNELMKVIDDKREHIENNILSKNISFEQVYSTRYEKIKESILLDQKNYYELDNIKLSYQNLKSTLLNEIKLFNPTGKEIKSMNLLLRFIENKIDDIQKLVKDIKNNDKVNSSKHISKMKQVKIVKPNEHSKSYPTVKQKVKSKSSQNSLIIKQIKSIAEAGGIEGLKYVEELKKKVIKGDYKNKKRIN